MQQNNLITKLGTVHRVGCNVCIMHGCLTLSLNYCYLSSYMDLCLFWLNFPGKSIPSVMYFTWNCCWFSVIWEGYLLLVTTQRASKPPPETVADVVNKHCPRLLAPKLKLAVLFEWKEDRAGVCLWNMHCIWFPCIICALKLIKVNSQLSNSVRI